MNDVGPWFEHLPQMSGSPCESFPRLFKSHSPYTVFPAAYQKRHIVVICGSSTTISGGWTTCLNVFSDSGGFNEVMPKEVFHVYLRHGFVCCSLPRPDNSWGVTSKISGRRFNVVSSTYAYKLLVVLSCQQLGSRFPTVLVIVT